MAHVSREERLAGVLARIAACGEEGATVKEVTPAQGGIRQRDVDLLVKDGRVEWITGGERCRAKSSVPSS